MNSYEYKVYDRFGYVTHIYVQKIPPEYRSELDPLGAGDWIVGSKCLPCPQNFETEQEAKKYAEQLAIELANEER